SREVCITRRIRTNTPLQALNSLNDSAFLVLAKQFAFNMQKAGVGNATKQISIGYERMMYKPITDAKMKSLIGLYDTALKKYTTDRTAAAKIIGTEGEDATAETAAMIVVANAMMNLDEWVNRN
ncbi:MAG TPA: DUF1553 domain-containing protein, partial [Ferruginibacter sp.]|nr:DUF1553 domain-containing protein [Ferruginibacter sp.]